ncbi:hypothetical protein DSECCO2_538130 [anaerobic digester metagenome]
MVSGIKFSHLLQGFFYLFRIRPLVADVFNLKSPEQINLFVLLILLLPGFHVHGVKFMQGVVTNAGPLAITTTCGRKQRRIWRHAGAHNTPFAAQQFEMFTGYLSTFKFFNGFLKISFALSHNYIAFKYIFFYIHCIEQPPANRENGTSAPHWRIKLSRQYLCRFQFFFSKHFTQFPVGNHGIYFFGFILFCHAWAYKDQLKVRPVLVSRYPAHGYHRRHNVGQSGYQVRMIMLNILYNGRAVRTNHRRIIA